MDYVVVRSSLSRTSYRNFFSYRQDSGIDKIYWSLLMQTSDVLLNPGQLSDKVNRCVSLYYQSYLIRIMNFNNG